MTLPSRSSTIHALVAYLHTAVGSTIQVHGVELPAGFALRSAALVLPDGGEALMGVPMVEERFTIHCYGTTFLTAISNDMAVFGALHRAAAAKSAAITGGTIYIPTAYRVMGPVVMRDPGTEWPRVTSSYMITFSEWVAQ